MKLKSANSLSMLRDVTLALYTLCKQYYEMMTPIKWLVRELSLLSNPWLIDSRRARDREHRIRCEEIRPRNSVGSQSICVGPMPKLRLDAQKREATLQTVRGLVMERTTFS